MDTYNRIYLKVHVYMHYSHIQVCNSVLPRWLILAMQHLFAILIHETHPNQYQPMWTEH